MLKLNMYPRGFWLRVAITATCQMAFVLFGYDQGVLSGIVGNPDFVARFNPSQDSALEGITVSIYNLGAFAGCIINFFVGEKLGRRNAIGVAMCWVIAGAILQASSFSLAQLMVARFVTGIGTGIDTSTIPMYQSELCEANKRGRLVSSEPLFVGFGIVIAYWFDFGMSSVAGPVAWRLPVAFQIFFAIIVVILLLGIPESPRYLYNQGHNDEALRVLCDVYDQPPDSAKITREQNDILDALALEKEHGEYRWSQLLKRDHVQTGTRVALAYGMQFMNQMGGINLIVYFVPTALETNVGLSRNLSLVIGGAVNCMFPIGSLFPTFFLDRLGRRKPMMWGSFGCALSMMMISILLSFQTDKASNPGLAHATASASVTFFFTYMLCFGATANCIPWVYVPEILPLHARAKGTAVGISANWLWNFFVVMISPVIIDSLAWKAYLVFMCLNFAFVPLVYYVYPETANLTLEDVDYLFAYDPEAEVQEDAKTSIFKTLLRGSRPVRRSLGKENDYAGNLAAERRRSSQLRQRKMSGDQGSDDMEKGKEEAEYIETR